MSFLKSLLKKYKIEAGYPQKVSGSDLLQMFWDITPDDKGSDRVERIIKEIGGIWELKKVKISDIPWEAATVSGKESQKLIKEYSKQGEMPPIILDIDSNLKSGKSVFDADAWESSYEIIDGFHRIAAAKKRGDTEILAYLPCGN